MVGGRGDAIDGTKVGFGIQKMFVDGLSHQYRMAPTHGESGTAGKHGSVTRQAQLGWLKWRKRKVLNHPWGKTKTVVEVVQIDLGSINGSGRSGVKLCQKVRSREKNWIRLLEHSVGGASINDETKAITTILGHGKDTVDDVDRRLEADHAEIMKTTDKLYVLVARSTEGCGTRLATCWGGAKKKLRRGVTLLEVRRKKIKKCSCTCHRGQRDLGGDDGHSGVDGLRIAQVL